MYTSPYNSTDEVLDAITKGEIDPYTGQQILNTEANAYLDNHNVFNMGHNPWLINEQQEKSFNNLLSRYQSQNALTWQKDQLEKMGLSAAGVLQTGAAHTAQDMSNIASNKANRLNNIARSFIHMAGSMGSAGIRGAALDAVKGAASTAASRFAHSASAAMNRSDSYWSNTHTTKDDDELLAFFDGR